MAQILCTWRVAYHADHGQPPTETLRGATKEAAMAELRKLMAAAVAPKITAEVVDERGSRIAKHTWTRTTGTTYVRSSKFD